MAKTKRTMEFMTWWDYVQGITGGAPNAAVAQKIGVTPPSVGRWKNGGPSPRQAREFARAYDRPVLEAFINAGFLSPDEAGETPGGMPDVTQLDDDELLAEVRRRMKEGDHDGWQPDDEKIMKDRGADGGSENGGGRSRPGQRRRGIIGYGRAPRDDDDDEDE